MCVRVCELVEPCLHVVFMCTIVYVCICSRVCICVCACVYVYVYCVCSKCAPNFLAISTAFHILLSFFNRLREC
jgi:type IV secretory pathway VirB3-like protein